MKLHIKDDAGKTTTVPMARDEITIGRKDGNTIRLTEKNVSRTHARLIKKGEEVHVEDLSRYGTRVNGERIQQIRRVGAGDTIQIGDYTLTLEGLKAVEPPAPAAQVAAAPAPVDPKAEARKKEVEQAARAHIAAAKAELSGDSPKEAPAPAKKDATAPPAEEERKSRGAGKKRIGAGHPTLVAVTTHLAGTEFPITSDTAILGRTGENDIKVDHHSISRNHAKVVVKDGQVRMVDLQSKNGIRVNGEYWEESILKSGDIIELGKVQFRFVEKGEEFIFRPEDYSAEALAASASQGEAKKGSKAWLAILLLVLVAGLVAVYFLVIAKDKPVSNVVVPPTKAPETTAAKADVVTPPPADTAVAKAPEPDTAAPPSPDVAAQANDLMLKAKAAFTDKKWDEAAQHLDKLLALDKENAEAKTLAGRVASEKNVLAIFTEASAANEKKDLNAAWAALQKLQSMPADSVYAPQVNELKNAVGPAIVASLVEQSRQALNAKKWNDAIAKAEEALRVDPVNRDAQNLLARAKRGKAEEKEASKPPEPGKSGDELYKEARALHNTNPDGALKLYEQAARAGVAVAYKQIGVLKGKKGDTAGAVAAYKAYLKNMPAARDADTVKDVIMQLGGTP